MRRSNPQEMCLDFPTEKSEFPPWMIDALRTLLIAAKGHADYNEIIPDVDNKELSKFAQTGNALDYRIMGPKFRAVYRGLRRYYAQDAPIHLVREMSGIVSRVFTSRTANRIEEFSQALHTMYGVPDYDPMGGHAWLPGTYWIYRPGEPVDGTPTIVKSALLIEPREYLDHCFLFFKIVYPWTYFPVTGEQLREARPLPEADLRRIHGVVLAKQRELYFVGRDRNGCVPYQIVAEDPGCRTPRLTGLMTRRGTRAVSFASRVLIERRPDKARGSLETFRGLYPSIGVFPAKHLIEADTLQGWSAIAGGQSSIGHLSTWTGHPDRDSRGEAA
ncbi:MAG: hypothetical protein ABL907_19835 [Hyphomicrobium sp.]